MDAASCFSPVIDSLVSCLVSCLPAGVSLPPGALEHPADAYVPLASHSYITQQLVRPTQPRAIVPPMPPMQKARDECVALHGPESEQCKALIEAHQQCLRKEGFNV